jgi:hypothetical protein
MLPRTPTGWGLLVVLRMGSLSLLSVVTLSSCVRGAEHPGAPVEERQHVVFPQFYAQAAVVVGGQGQVYELDGVMLRALKVAAEDFFPPTSEERPCWQKPEAHLYRVIRQADIIFVLIGPDPSACRRKFLMFDSDVKYAISLDGRILRRGFDGEPEGSFGPESSDAGRQGDDDSGQPVPTSAVGTYWGEPAEAVLPEFLRRRDGGEDSDGGTGDGGSPK